jgi:hypothetical protein
MSKPTVKMIYRITWPIKDPTVPMAELLKTAQRDMPGHFLAIHRAGYQQSGRAKARIVHQAGGETLEVLVPLKGRPGCRTLRATLDQLRHGAGPQDLPRLLGLPKPALAAQLRACGRGDLASRLEPAPREKPANVR